MGQTARRVKVLLPLPLAGAYDYLLPEDLDAETGAFVRVPLGNRVINGVIWGPGDEGGVAAEKLKEVEAVLPVPVLPEANRSMVDWMAGYYLCAPGAALRMMMSVPAALEPPPTKTAYRGIDAGPPGDIKLTSARRRVLEVAGDGFARSARALGEEAGVTTGVIKALASKGALEIVAIPDLGRFEAPDPSSSGPDLSGEQEDAANGILAKIAADDFSVSVLDGVTGSGKTEVYFEAIAAVLKAGKQVLVLLPEISLSSQWLSRFNARFGAMPAEWHSDLSPPGRRRTWRAVAEGRIRVLVGARSALHLPFSNLGLIVVDEEHEPAFKQEDGVAYNARDVAIVRAHKGGIPIILCSATPSLETVLNVAEGRYESFLLQNRHGAAVLPSTEIIDITKDKPGRQKWVSPVLRDALVETLKAGEQSLLFLNRRGYAPLTLCRTCGHRIACPNCSAWLVEHRFTGRLQCHHCGYAARKPQSCPECGDTDSFAACGPGVERLQEEVSQFLPDARVELVTSDTIHSPAEAAAFVSRMQNKEVDLIIGTQIIAKGFHFPNLTLVGVVDADLGLAGGDLRAAERTYQLMQQVSGRAGRGEQPGRVFLQTANPATRVIQALSKGDRDGFVEAELYERQCAVAPPYGRLAALIISSQDEGVADNLAAAFGRQAPRSDGLLILGPAPAPISLLRGRFRRRLLLRAERGVSVQKVLTEWLSRIKVPSNARVQVDVDPYSFL